MNNLLQAIVNVAGLLPVMTGLVVLIAFIAGLVFFSQALVAMARPANSHNVDVKLIATNMFIGTILISLGFGVIVMTQTMFQTSSVSSAEDIFAYAPNTIGLVQDETTRTVIRSIVGIVQFIGLIGFIRGLFLFSAYAKQNVRTVGPAFTFVFAGILAMNFPRVVQGFSQLFS